MGTTLGRGAQKWPLIWFPRSSQEAQRSGGEYRAGATTAAATVTGIGRPAPAATTSTTTAPPATTTTAAVDARHAASACAPAHERAGPAAGELVGDADRAALTAAARGVPARHGVRSLII
jgi:hypothetical protein